MRPSGSSARAHPRRRFPTRPWTASSATSRSGRPRARIGDEAFRWHTEIDTDELEYLLCALFRLDARLSAEAQRRRPCDEGRLFYLVLVRALLHALETGSPGRAAFADQLRSAWPSAADVA
jgi:hypothetical protein